MTIQENIQKGIQLAFQNIFNHSIESQDLALAPTRKEFEGTYTFVVFPYLKISRTTPENTATLIGEYLQENVKEVAGFNVVKGFLNLVLDQSSWLDLFTKIYQNSSRGQMPSNGKRVMVEYSSPNTNKPLHLGHLRNNFLGYSVAQILEANGYEVIKSNLVNDRGIHICKSMVAYLRFGNGETPESSGLKGDHLAGKYYVLFDKEYKNQIKALVASGQTEDAAKKKMPLSYSKLRKCSESGKQMIWKPSRFGSR